MGQNIISCHPAFSFCMPAGEKKRPRHSGYPDSQFTTEGDGRIVEFGHAGSVDALLSGALFRQDSKRFEGVTESCGETGPTRPIHPRIPIGRNTKPHCDLLGWGRELTVESGPRGRPISQQAASSGRSGQAPCGLIFERGRARRKKRRNSSRRQIVFVASQL